MIIRCYDEENAEVFSKRDFYERFYLVHYVIVNSQIFLILMYFDILQHKVCAASVCLSVRHKLENT